MVLFVLLLYVPVNSNGHYMRVSSPNHTLSWASLNKWLSSTLCTLWLVTTTFLNDSFSGREENGRRSESPRKYGTRSGSHSQPLEGFMVLWFLCP